MEKKESIVEDFTAAVYIVLLLCVLSQQKHEDFIKHHVFSIADFAVTVEETLNQR